MPRTTIPHKAIRLISFLILLGLAFSQFHLALFEQSEFSQKTESSLLKYQSNPYLLIWLAKQKHLYDADFDAAQNLYKQALIANSVHLPAWLGLAELQFDQGQIEKANAILDYSSQLSTDIKRWRWDEALVAYRLGRKDILAADLVYIIKEIGGKQRNDALRLAFSVWPNPLELQKAMGSENLIHLFQYTTRKKKVEEGLVFWKILESKGIRIQEQENDILPFINMLLFSGDVAAAAQIWKTYFNPTRFAYNGNFKKKPLQKAFGWRIGKNKGGSWKLQKSNSKGEPARLHLHFNRKKNVNLANIQQIVPLPGGKSYGLKCRMKTNKLTTDQRPYLELYGHKCKMPLEKTEMVESDQEWRDYILVFDVPQECSAVVVRLRRQESIRIDNKLAGDVWLTNFEIAETSAPLGRVKEIIIRNIVLRNGPRS